MLGVRSKTIRSDIRAFGSVTALAEYQEVNISRVARAAESTGFDASSEAPIFSKFWRDSSLNPVQIVDYKLQVTLFR